MPLLKAHQMISARTLSDLGMDVPTRCASIHNVYSFVAQIELLATVL